MLKQMQVPGLSITDMFMRVRAEVMKQTAANKFRGKRHRWLESFIHRHANRHFIRSSYFKNRSYGVRVKLLGHDQEQQSIDDFKSYLERYPQGQFVALAKTELPQCNRSPTAETSAPVTGVDKPN